MAAKPTMTDNADGSVTYEFPVDVEVILDGAGNPWGFIAHAGVITIPLDEETPDGD